MKTLKEMFQEWPPSNCSGAGTRAAQILMARQSAVIVSVAADEDSGSVTLRVKDPADNYDYTCTAIVKNRSLVLRAATVLQSARGKSLADAGEMII